MNIVFIHCNNLSNILLFITVINIPEPKLTQLVQIDELVHITILIKEILQV